MLKSISTQMRRNRRSPRPRLQIEHEAAASRELVAHERELRTLLIDQPPVRTVIAVAVGQYCTPNGF
jgi:hypothetical protein